MALFRICITQVIIALVLVSRVAAQTISPSNDTTEIPSYDAYPRFWVNGTKVPSFRVVPVNWYSGISQQVFLNIQIDGRLLQVDPSNAQNLPATAIDYISCDYTDYTGVLTAADVVRIVSSSQGGNSIILYSQTANHCDTSNLRDISPANGIFTTIDPVVAATVLSQISNSTDGQPTVISPDPNSYTQPSGLNQQGPGPKPGPTTAVAMIILYTITGLITALFVIIIVTGAVRAHRHPERYGPSNSPGRPRRSRAKGIARAMLDTLPIVKFGERDETPKKEADIEMNRPASEQATTKSVTTEVVETVNEDAATPAKEVNPDGTDETGNLGCSICTEDFNKGEEVRMLPCSHKFHPECVDPWLLNVSGTCPLCRIDLRPKDEQAQESNTEVATTASSPPRRISTAAVDLMAPPLSHLPIRLDRDQRNRRDTALFAGLRSAATASREDRIAALRRFRQQRRGQTETPEQEEERKGLSTRLKERFRIRTRREGEEEGNASSSQSRASMPRIPLSMLPSHT